MESAPGALTGFRDDDVAALLALLDACHRVLAGLDAGREDAIATSIRETCSAVETRLNELGVSFPDP